MDEYELKFRASALKKAEEAERAIANLPDRFRLAIDGSRNDQDFHEEQSKRLISWVVGGNCGSSELSRVHEEIKEEILRPAVVAMLEALSTRYRALVSGPLPKKRSEP